MNSSILSKVGANFQSNKQGLNILIEGNVGCGKTTILNYLKNKYKNKINILPESIEDWKNVNNVNLLDLMYKQPKRWAFTFQNYVHLTMVKNHEKLNFLKEHQTEKINLMERSIFSSRYIFIENLYRRNLLTKFEYNILNDYFQYFNVKDKFKIDLIIYLRSCSKLSYENIKKRGRPEEIYLTKLDLENLNDLYENLFGEKNEFSSIIHDIPILRIDILENKEKMFQLMDAYFNILFEGNHGK